MSTKGFVILLIGVLLLGGSIGGAFVGVLALVKSQEAEVSQTNLTANLPSLPGQQSSDQSTQDDLDQLRQQFKGQSGPGFASGSSIMGTLEKVEGNTITVNTPKGTLQATVGENTTIQKIDEVTIADLLEGMYVTVTGAPGEDGAVEARSIVITPEGAGGFFGGGFPGGM